MQEATIIHPPAMRKQPETIVSDDENDEPKEYLLDLPGESDILCAQGLSRGLHLRQRLRVASRQWPGNWGFREIIHQAQPTYATSSPQEKQALVETTCDKVFKERRFVGVDPITSQFYVLSKKAAQREVAQALRWEQRLPFGGKPPQGPKVDLQALLEEEDQFAPTSTLLSMSSILMVPDQSLESAADSQLAMLREPMVEFPLHTIPPDEDADTPTSTTNSPDVWSSPDLATLRAPMVEFPLDTIPGFDLPILREARFAVELLG